MVNRTTARGNATRTNKPKRIPLGSARDVLTVGGQDPAYHYRWVVDNDEKGSRLLKFQQAGYEFAPVEGLEIGDRMVFTSENVGSIARLPSGTTGDYLYLMRTPMEYYDEDKQAHANHVDSLERQLIYDKDEGQYGKTEVSFS